MNVEEYDVDCLKGPSWGGGQPPLGHVSFSVRLQPRSAMELQIIQK